MKKLPLNIVIAEAVLLGVFEPLVRALQEAHDEVEREFSYMSMQESEYAYDSDPFDILHISIRHDPQEYIDCICGDEELTLLNRYINKASMVLEGSDPSRFGSYFNAEDVMHLLESLPDFDKNVELQLDPEFIFINKRRSITKGKYLGLLYCVPFFYFLTRPLERHVDATTIISSMKIALTKDDPITFAKLKRELKLKHKIDAKESFLYMLALNDPNFLIVTKGAQIKVDRADEIIGQFYDLKSKIKPRDYIKSSSKIRFYVGEEINVNESQLRMKIEIGQYAGRFLNQLDLKELGTKLYLDYLMSGQGRRNISSYEIEEIKKKVVQLIKKLNRTLRYSEILRHLKLENLPFEPKTLGPGELLAYGMAEHHKTRNGAMYTIKDMVGSEGQMRMKINPERIITPLIEKRWDFDDSNIAEAIRNDITYSEFGIADAYEIALSIAGKLEDRPTELYYINRIQLIVIQYLLVDHRELFKKRYYIKNSIDIQKRDDERPVRYRIRVVAHVCNLLPRQVNRETLERFGQANANRLMALI